MDQSGLEVLRDHLDFMKWLIGGAAAGVAIAAGVIYRTVLTPMRDGYLQERIESKLILGRIADGIDSTKKHVKGIPCRVDIGVPDSDAPTEILPPKRPPSYRPIPHGA